MTVSWVWDVKPYKSINHQPIITIIIVSTIVRVLVNEGETLAPVPGPSAGLELKPRPLLKTHAQLQKQLSQCNACSMPLKWRSPCDRFSTSCHNTDASRERRERQRVLKHPRRRVTTSRQREPALRKRLTCKFIHKSCLLHPLPYY